MNKNTLLIGIAVLAVVVTGVLVGAKYSSGNMLSFLHVGMSKDQITQKSIDYLNKNVLQQGQTASLVSSTEESGVVKMKIKIGTSTYDSYATTDGKLLFPEAFSIDTKATAQAASTTQNTASVTPDNVKKVANTSLIAYVVADCPYGLQMQRAMAEAVKAIPALANYIQVKYIGSASGNNIYSMHDSDASGKQVANGLEAKENLKQVCIEKEQPAKYWPYVACYMKKSAGNLPNTMPIGDSAGCSTAVGIDTAKLNSCISDPSRGLAYIKADFALGDKNNVQGSPTLILNGTTIDETPFGGRSADGIKNIICDSSATQPDFCKTKLSTSPANTSFSLTYAPTTASATTASAAACAPAAQ
jgi:hypothetical protein